MATHLADTSVLARLDDDDVAVRVGPMFLGGRIATCAFVDLEILRTSRHGPAHAEAWFERQLLPRVPFTESSAQRAIEVQGLLADSGRHRSVALEDLLIAALAEQDGLTVLHYDQDFDLIADVTGQPTEWVVGRGTVP